jgi:hypothetical protein
MAKHKYIETPEELLKLWDEYKEHTKNNPRYKYELNRMGQPTAIPLEVPLTIQKFEIYVKNKYGWTIGQYFDNQDKLYNEYIAICSHIRTERSADQIEGGMVGQYNASITQRLNGLVEKTQTDVNITKFEFDE